MAKENNISFFLFTGKQLTHVAFVLGTALRESQGAHSSFPEHNVFLEMIRRSFHCY